MEEQNDALPYFLQSYENLLNHFDQHLPEGTTAKGTTFAELVRRVIPHTEFGSRFPEPRLTEKKSHDGGVDVFTSENDAGECLFAQSKFKLKSRDEFDNVVSKFHDFETRRIAATSNTLFDEGESSRPTSVYLMVTSSKLVKIREAYEQSSLPSVVHYRVLRDEGRLHVIDGPALLHVLQRLYRQSHLLPTDIRLESVAGWLELGNVRIGVVRGADLVQLWRDTGSSLFFENIRDFLGATSGRKVEDRVSVNTRIVNTVNDEPGRMLERNNGITFRASALEEVADRPNTITIRQAAIVNGCQTTMCLVSAKNVSPDCLVAVKVVVTEDSWEVASAANYQNPVALIELDLARYLRPQLVQKVAADTGYGYGREADESATGVLDSIYQNRIDYDELKLLYLGIFSQKPSNLFESLYTKLLTEVLRIVYADRANETLVFNNLFLLLVKSREAFSLSEKTYADPDYAILFKRFKQADKPSYRMYLSLLAASGALREDLSVRKSEPEAEAARLLSFINRLEKLLQGTPGDFNQKYLLAFQVLADTAMNATTGTESDVAQNMYNAITRAPFSTLYRALLMRVDAYAAMRNSQ